tara:strand:+ start:917 stop:1084 length:168 start_codon:yes stop_codon:yes gene_type:complete
MEQSSVLQRLRNVDRELHSLIDELDSKKEQEMLSLDELNRRMQRDRISDEDIKSK